MTEANKYQHLSISRGKLRPDFVVIRKGLFDVVVLSHPEARHMIRELERITSEIEDEWNEDNDGSE